MRDLEEHDAVAGRIREYANRNKQDITLKTNEQKLQRVLLKCIGASKIEL